ncbi:MAG: C2H2-type zinc finger protein [Chloroflexi bacterium]|nr:C2H2-type zinc finger protein [Chloroflexota bacterium]
MADEQLVCEECSQTFRTDWALEGHMKRDHGAQVDTSSWRERVPRRLGWSVLGTLVLIGVVVLIPILRGTVFSSSDPDAGGLVSLNRIAGDLNSFQLSVVRGLVSLRACQTEADCSEALLQMKIVLPPFELALANAIADIGTLEFSDPDGDRLVAAELNVWELRSEAVQLWLEGLERGNDIERFEAGDLKWSEAAAAESGAVDALQVIVDKN